MECLCKTCTNVCVDLCGFRHAIIKYGGCVIWVECQVSIFTHRKHFIREISILKQTLLFCGIYKWCFLSKLFIRLHVKTTVGYMAPVPSGTGHWHWHTSTTALLTVDEKYEIQNSVSVSPNKRTELEDWSHISRWKIFKTFICKYYCIRGQCFGWN